MASGHAQEIVLPWLHLFLEGIKQKMGWREGQVETLQGQGAPPWDGTTRMEALRGCHLIKGRAGALPPAELPAGLLPSCSPRGKGRP